MTESYIGKDQYWMRQDGSRLASHLDTYHQKFFSTSFNPIWQTWIKNSYAYYSPVLDSQSWWSALEFTGEQGELVRMKVPQAKALIRQFITLICKQKAAFRVTAMTDKRDVVEEMRIGNALCEKIVKDQELDRKKELMAEAGCVVGTSFIKTTFRTDWGEEVGVSDTGGILYSGALDISVPRIDDMLYDFSVEEWRDLDWVECRVIRNRWSLIQMYPDLENEIKQLPSVVDARAARDYFGFNENDNVYVYELYHKPSPALPNGRMLVYSDHKTIYYDGPNLYDCIPIEQFKPEPIMGMGFGFPMLSYLLGSQEMYDYEFSALATNHSATAVQNIAVARGSDINIQELYGMNILNYTPQNVPGGGKPEALMLNQDSPNAYKQLDYLLNNMQTMSNINAALRGDLGSSASGVAIATLTTNALEFLNSYTRSITDALEKTIMHGINAYRRFVKQPQMVRLTGKNYQSYAKEFTGDQLAPIQSVRIESINPLMQTMAGRLDIAEKLAASGLIKTIDEYVAVLDGQPLSKLSESDLSQSDLVSQENEYLLEGRPVFVLATDNHALHIQKHAMLLNDTAVRSQSDKVQSILEHIEQHNQQMKTVDPMLQAAVLTGRAPEAPPPPQGGEPIMEEQLPAEEVGLPEAAPAAPAEDLLGRT